ncbi:hypothetical protein [Saliphagus sp. LR7]|uniref:hypothetical protein n=1 Tax=Saliphagus sp. LR7 TaxID=2282654 RepID=UPI0018E4EFAB|nr:hypothetical protein [Saliphagus sp. LR7]
MSNTFSNIERQKRTGYVLVAGAPVILLGSIPVLLYYDVPPVFYLGMLVPASILVFFGYKRISAGRNHQALQDERTAELYRKSGSTSFWWLIGIVYADASFDIFPDEGAQILSVICGMAIYGIHYTYYRYIE